MIPIQPHMIPLRNISDIKEGDRVFYELGYKPNPNKISYIDNWVRIGQFKEIEDVWHLLSYDTSMVDPAYLEHHNFMIIACTLT